ncbi:hypothetical protein B5K08_05390 [Rhizobium leguminosarum bv. trifolii]|uniref:Transmembrane protein n=1 Tax=Rhizobium leguminosarum bv. trifolii TaxID=386 RepID=A0A3E1BXP4_RHILT|nr:hypothetical protein B5K08_05390 [Rhizobium leguminosarum bv. trifolii]RFB99936.1 hypothetical protein B5K10_05380 [Rhizobium leguminosarum bv. trifolii]
MKHPQFIHGWRNFWRPPNSWAESLARRQLGEEPSKTHGRLEAIVRERQADMPPYWVSCGQVAAHVLVIGLVVWAVVHFVF